MRTTLTLDDDVAVRLERLREERGHTFKAVVNDVLRRGLDSLGEAASKRVPYRIEPHDAGRCYLPNLDDTHAVLAFGVGEAHGSAASRGSKSLEWENPPA